MLDLVYKAMAYTMALEISSEGSHRFFACSETKASQNHISKHRKVSDFLSDAVGRYVIKLSMGSLLRFNILVLGHERFIVNRNGAIHR